MKVAFIGLGNMGFPMSKNLIKAGYEVYGFNRSEGKMKALAEYGAKTGYTLQELVQLADAVITSLPYPSDVEHVYLGVDGIIANGRQGQIAIDMSTVSPDLVRRICAEADRKGMEFLDAPVSGGTAGAEAATLSIMAGGNEEAFRQAMPLFQAMGSNIYYTGAVGSGTIVKLINQYMVGIHTAAAGEALVLADKMGVDKEMLFNILNASFAQSRIFERHYTNYVAKEQFQAGFALKLLHKDLSLAAKMAGDNGVDLPLGAPIATIYNEAQSGEFADRDMSAMYLVLKERNREARRAD